MIRFCIAALLIPMTFATVAQDEHLKWAGHVALPNGQQMPLELEVFKTPHTTTANVRSPAQGVQNIPVTAFRQTVNTLSMQLPTLGAALQLQPNNEGCLAGALNQGMALPVELCPTQSLTHDDYLASLPEGVTELDELRFQSADGSWLSGTLYQPVNQPQAPVVILSGGSGASDRDGSFAGKKPYRNFGIELAKQGIALFTFDKRGVRRSGGDYTQATVEQYAQDIQAAYQLIRSMKAINPEKIGFVGHSEGATVVAMALAEVNADFVISLGGVGLNGIDAIVLQDKTESMARGASAEQAEVLQQIAREYYAIVLNAPDDKAREQQAKAWLASLSEQQRDVYQQYGADTYTLAVDNVNDKALFSILATDPTQHWQRVCVPALILNGDKDVQVPAVENVAGLEQALASCRHPATKVKILANYNHMLQPTTDGNIELYAELPEGFDENLSTDIAAWIRRLR